MHDRQAAAGTAMPEPPRFATDAELGVLRASCDAADPAGLAALAWLLRQRDCREALRLVVQASSLLDRARPPLRDRLVARLTLVRAELSWLFAELEEAQRRGEQALCGFIAAGCAAGASDAHWLLAWIATDRGDLDVRDAALQASIDAAEAAADELRQELGEAALARSTAFRDLHQALDRWGGRYLGRELDMHPALVVWIADYCAVVSSKLQRVGPAVAYGVRMHEAALTTGQLERAMTAASNIGFDLTRLDDLQAALEWMQQGLELARHSGWPASIGSCLTETAETLRRLGRLDAARELLDEALVVLRPLGRSRWSALALNYRGDIELDRDNHAAALSQFERLQVLADGLPICRRSRDAVRRRRWRHSAAAPRRCAPPNRHCTWPRPRMTTTTASRHCG